jgi:hypothetical protein
MSPEKSQELIAIYPKLFSDLHPMQAVSMFGIECGDGWFELLKECIQGLKEVCEKHGYDTRVSQIKEKYGTLRFYLDSTSDEMDEVIYRAEEKSAVTCESCGNPGSMNKTGYWMSVRCGECLEEMRKMEDNSIEDIWKIYQLRGR